MYGSYIYMYVLPEVLRESETLVEAAQFIQYLHNLSDMGAAMRHVITRAASDKQIYTNFLQGSS